MAFEAASDKSSRLGNPRLTRYHDFLRMFRRNRGAVIGTILVMVIAALALAAPVITPHDPFEQRADAVLASPSADYWFGNDHLGRDVLSRLLHGARLSLSVGIVAVVIAVGFGIVLGLVSGFYGSIIDSFIMRFMDVLLAFPGILLAMAIIAVLGSNLFNLMIAVGVGSIPTFTRVVRGSVLAARETPYTLSARAIGCRDLRIMFVHILPNVMAPIIVLSTLQVASAILAASGLSFIGLGAQPPTAEWGAMLSAGRDYMRDAPWLTTFPGLAIMVTILAINMMGDGLRDALDPRLRQK